MKSRIQSPLSRPLFHSRQLIAPALLSALTLAGCATSHITTAKLENSERIPASESDASQEDDVQGKSLKIDFTYKSDPGEGCVPRSVRVFTKSKDGNTIPGTKLAEIKDGWGTIVAKGYETKIPVATNPDPRDRNWAPPAQTSYQVEYTDRNPIVAFSFAVYCEKRIRDRDKAGMSVSWEWQNNGVADRELKTRNGKDSFAFDLADEYVPTSVRFVKIYFDRDGYHQLESGQGGTAASSAGSHDSSW